MFDGATQHDMATGKNEDRPLPPAMRYLADYRVSVQVRQKDPPEEWGWPPSTN